MGANISVSCFSQSVRIMHISVSIHAVGWFFLGLTHVYTYIGAIVNPLLPEIRICSSSTKITAERNFCMARFSLGHTILGIDKNSIRTAHHITPESLAGLVPAVALLVASCMCYQLHCIWNPWLQAKVLSLPHVLEIHTSWIAIVNKPHWYTHRPRALSNDACHESH